MSEVANQIDLTWDIEKQVSGIQLSPEQQKSFTQFLEAKKQTEKEGILIMTGEELWELRQIFEGNAHLTGLSKDIQEKTLEGDVNSFIDTQLLETVELWDIYTWTPLGEFTQGERGGEIKEHLSKASDNLLFGEAWLFWEIPDISPDAKYNLATSLQLALIENFTQNPEKLALLKAAIDGWEAEVQKLVDTFWGIQENFSQYKESLKSLSLSKNGEQNTLFMNPTEGKDFFKKLLAGEIQDIKWYIESKNTTETVTISPEQIAKLQSEATLPTEAQQVLEEIQENPDKLQEFIEKMKQMSPLIWGILEVLFGLVQWFSELLKDENTTIQEANEVFSKMLADEKSIFSGKKIPDDLFTSKQRENTVMKEQLTSLFGEDAKQTEIEIFFRNDGKFQKFTQAGNLPNIFSNSWDLNVSLLSANLQAYTKYKEANTKHNPTGETGKNLLYSEYFSNLSTTQSE